MHYNYTLQQLVKLIIDMIVKLYPKIDFNDHYNTIVPTSKVICIGIIADIKFSSNHQATLAEFKTAGLDEFKLDKSQFSRRIRLVDCLVEELTTALAYYSQSQLDTFPMKQIDKNEYVVDTKPVAICHNIRISRCKLVGNHLIKTKIKNKKNEKYRKKVNEDYRGLCASKHQYYYGFKLNIIKNCLDLPVEYSIHPASCGDIECLKSMNLNLPVNSNLLADKAYNDIELEQNLKEFYGINLKPIRKKNSKQMYNSDSFLEFCKRICRKPIETMFSQFSTLKTPFHAVTLEGFLIKIHLSVLSRSIQQLLKLNLLTT
jgi:Transposase DDE domain